MLRQVEIELRTYTEVVSAWLRVSIFFVILAFQCIEFIEIPSIVDTESAQQYPIKEAVGTIRRNDVGHVQQEVDVARDGFELIFVVKGSIWPCTLDFPSLCMQTHTNLGIKVPTDGESHLWCDKLCAVKIGECGLRPTLYRNEVVGIMILHALCLSCGGHSKEECHSGCYMNESFHNMNHIKVILIAW